MGTPLKNQNFQNRTSTRFKLARIRSRIKISETCTNIFWAIFFIRATPLNNVNFWEKFCLYIFRKKIFSLSKFQSYVLKWLRFSKKHENPIFLHWTIWAPHLKNQNFGLRHVLTWPKLGLEPKFHESWTIGGFGKRAQSVIQYPADFLTLDHMGNPPS